MAEITRISIPSTRRVVAFGSIAADMVDYTIKRASEAVASAGSDFSVQSVKLLFSPSYAAFATSNADVNNWGTIGAVVQAGIVGSNGSRELDEGVLQHNYTGDTAPGKTTTEIITTGDVDGGNF